MKISGLSHLLKAIKPQPDLERTARAMAAHPGAASSEFGKLMTFINNTAHQQGVGFVGRDAQRAGAALQQALAESSAGSPARTTSTQQFARQLQYLGPLKQNFVAQKGRGSLTPEREQAIDTLVDYIEGLQNYRGPR
jgi:hypothetical protein